MAGGHRRISNALFLSAIRSKRKLTRVECLLWLDDDVYRREQRSVRQYADLWGTTRRTAASILRDYEEHRKDLKISRAYEDRGSGQDSGKSTSQGTIDCSRRRDPDPDSERSLPKIPSEFSPEIEPPAGGSRPRLTNLLANEKGDFESKRLWAIEHEPIIVAEAEAAHPRDAKARSAKVRSLTLRYWRAHLRRLDGSDARSAKVDADWQRLRERWG